MTRQQANFLKVICNDQNVEHEDVSYNPRHPHGYIEPSTIGIIVSSQSELMRAILNYFSDMLVDTVSSVEYNGAPPVLFDQFNVDTMGKNVIIY